MKAKHVFLLLAAVALVTAGATQTAIEVRLAEGRERRRRQTEGAI
jgi:hypothetical protein